MITPDKIRPVGFNLGGWLSQSNLTDEHTQSFIQKEDFKTIAGWGFNSVRLPVDGPWLFEKEGKGKISTRKLAFLKGTIKWANDAGLLTILDMHQTPWHSFAKPELDNLWKNEKDLDRFCESWMELAHALKRNEAPLWFDILNEPTAQDSEDWNHVASRAFRALRLEDPKRVLVIEPTFWGSVFKLNDLVEAVRGPNLVYSFHLYLPMLVTHQGAPWWKDGEIYKERVDYPGPIPKIQEYLAKDLAPATRAILDYENREWNKEALRDVLKPVELLSKKGFYLHCGEFGVYEKAPRTARLNWTKDVVNLFSQMNVGWAYWNYKWLDFGVIPQAEGGKSGPLDQEMLRILQWGIR
ncbi:MAG TPA: cellulase family glycosylhydrolase [bacterium]|nr:cellulase family glycosylhydrolase [bacterium]